MFQMKNHGLFLDTEILKKGNSVLSDSLSVFGSKFRVGRGDRLIIRNLVTSKIKKTNETKKRIFIPKFMKILIGEGVGYFTFDSNFLNHYLHFKFF